jgi:leucine-rich PPR motif-containing protein
VFDEMGKFGCRRTLRSCNRLLNQLVQAGDVGAAVSVFEQIRCAGTLPDEFTVAIMAKAYCRDGRVAQAADFVKEMEGIGVEVNLVAYHALMDGYCEVGQTEVAGRLLLSLKGKGLSPNVVTYTLLVKGYCKEGMMEKAERMVREIKENEKIVVDEVAYGALINGYCQRGEMENANRIRAEMPNSRLICLCITL